MRGGRPFGAKASSARATEWLEEMVRRGLGCGEVRERAGRALRVALREAAMAEYGSWLLLEEAALQQLALARARAYAL